MADRNALTPEHVQRSLVALSRAHELSVTDGHWGAAALAAYFLVEEVEPPSEVRAAIALQVEHLFEAFGELFRNNGSSPRVEDPARTIVDEIDQGDGGLHSLGHNVIFPTLAIQAMARFPDFATEEIVGGVVELVRQSNGSPAGGPFFGWEGAEVDQLDVESDRTFSSESDDRNLAIQALDLVTETPVYKGGHAGVVGHVLTHADALIELRNMGFGELAKRCTRGLRIHMKVVERRFDPGEHDLKPRTGSPDPPLSLRYWQSDLGSRSRWAYGHYFKYPLSFYRLARRAAVPELSDYEPRFRRLM